MERVIKLIWIYFDFKMEGVLILWYKIIEKIYDQSIDSKESELKWIIEYDKVYEVKKYQVCLLQESNPSSE